MFSEAIDRKFEARAEHLKRSQHRIANNLLQAESFFWADNIASSIAATLSYDDYIPEFGAEILPHDHCWFWFERPITIAALTDVHALLVSRTVWPQFPDGILSFRVYTGDMVHDFVESAPFIVEPLLFVRKACEWLSGTIVTTAREHVERHAQKRIERLGQDATRQALHVVKLRKAVRNGEPITSRHIEWTCRWIVRDHWRKLASGKTIKVRAYIKGPKDRAMKPIAPTVYAVTR